MSNEALKLELIEWLAQLDDQKILESLLQMKDRWEADPSSQLVADRKVSYERQNVQQDHAEDDWYGRLSDEQKASIERGRQDIAAGRVIPSEELWKKYGKAR